MWRGYTPEEVERMLEYLRNRNGSTAADDRDFLAILGQIESRPLFPEFGNKHRFLAGRGLSVDEYIEAFR